MLAVPAGIRACLASGPTDRRRGMNSLALQVQQVGADQRRSSDVPARRHRLAPAQAHVAAASGRTRRFAKADCGGLNRTHPVGHKRSSLWSFCADDLD